MSREEYLRELAKELRRLPREEYEKAMNYYIEFFEDAGPEHEAEVIADLGDPKDVASHIIRDAAMERMNNPQKSVKRGFSTIWIIILAICGAPIALPLAIGLLALVGGFLILMVSMLVMSLGLLASGIVSTVGGLIILFLHPASGIASMGAGLMIIGISILGTLLMLWIFEGIIRCIRALFRRIVRRGKKS